MAQAAAKLLTLTEVAKRTNISMPTLQRYKKLYQNRIPSEGSGRKQRYPKEALDIFLELKKENIGRRGRPRKNAAPAPAVAAGKKAKKTAKKAAPTTRGRKPAARKSKAKAKSGDELLTLTQVSKLTGVSYPTLLRYVKTNLADIPHQGEGRARRFKPGAVAVFKSLRQRSKRGRKSKAALAAAAAKPVGRSAKPSTSRQKNGGRRGRPPKVVDPAALLARIAELEKSHRQLERLVAKQQKQISKPYRVVLQR